MRDDRESSGFHDKGFALARGLVPEARMRLIAAEIEGLHERMRARAPDEVDVSWEEGLADGQPPRIRQLMNSERVSPLLDGVSRSAEVLEVVARLIGAPDLMLYHSKLMMKAARDGTFTPWHQDWGYWRHDANLIAPTQINCMLAIDAADEGNGAVRFVVGSHRGGLVPHATFQSSSFSLGLPGDLAAYESELVAMEPGDCLFFGALVIHGSGPNRSDRDRRANTFAFDAARNLRDWRSDDARARCSPGRS